MNCDKVKTLFSEYIDNTLSARDTWEVDRHIVDCNGCAGDLNEMRQTVSILAVSPRFEVSDDFIAKLQTRISAVEATQPRVNWLANVQEMFRPRLRPVWGAAMAAVALFGIYVLPRQLASNPVPVPGNAAISSMVKVAQTQNVAIAATDPLGDTAAASMAANNTLDQNAASSGQGAI